MTENGGGKAAGRGLYSEILAFLYLFQNSTYISFKGSVVVL